MHQKRTRPETMPAHTQTRRAEDKHMDRQMSADNTVLGFWAPWVFLPPGNRFNFPHGVHCSPDVGSGALLPAELAGTPSPFPTLYRKLSPAPDTFLLLSRASDLHWTFLSWPELRCYYLAFPSVLEVFSFLVKGSRMSPQMLCPMSESLSGKREGLQDNATCKKREVYCWLEPGLLPHPTQWCRVREPWAQAVTQIYRVSTRHW